MAGRILHVSDIHFGCENKAAVEAVLQIARTEAFDLVAITGDITQFGAPEEFAAARAFVNALPPRRLLTPGNHDVPYATPERLYAPFERYRKNLGEPWASSFEGPGLSARAFNSSRGAQVRINWSKGAVRERQVRRLVTSLDGVPADNLKLALCHHPLMEVTGGPMTGNVRGGAEAVSILAEGRIDAILTGHVHTTFAHALPCEDGKTYAIGAATLSLRERGQPAGFNIIEWEDGCIRVKAQGWTGSHFETIRSWGLPRR